MKLTTLLAAVLITTMSISVQASKLDDPTFRDGAVVVINNTQLDDPTFRDGAVVVINNTQLDDPTFRDGAVEVIDLEECGDLYDPTFCEGIEVLLQK